MTENNTQSAECLSRLNYELYTEIAMNTEKWQAIETAPKDGSRVIAWCEEYHDPTTMQYYCCVNEWMIDYDLGRMRYQPTHWMPLPKPPMLGV